MSQVAEQSDPQMGNIAVQGGGAHGVFGWGVLDALIEGGWIREEQRRRLRYIDIRSIRHDEANSRLGVASKSNIDWTFLTELCDLGRATTFAWAELRAYRLALLG